MLKAVPDILLAATAVTDLVGQRVKPIHEAQEQSLPYVTFQAVSVTRWESRDGPTGLATGTLRVICFADTFAGVVALSTAVRVALAHQTGVHGTETVHAITNIDGPQDLPKPPTAGGEVPVYAQSLNFEIIYGESTS